ncbi:tetratricopeptide repeat-containing sensor histidine kinase [Flavobacterium microcysteis]|uniref:Oxygen sensor histidine kinase NreB n=1 Tax=Flavobacterium microcysteis TaxID=2596891 RepID=A0A501PZY6_9FLAO|nr:tetratricopeptide repeat-containing sensor histidine kinase [Flavobacterium microcysteis]TPD65301.1 tetratricopeptide repeat protein [Flavobacterium microcysteis]
MKKTVFLFFVTGIISLTGCSKKKLDLSEKATDSISICLRLAYQDATPYQDRLLYNEKAFRLIMDKKNDSVQRLNLSEVANRYFNLNEMDKFHEISRILLKKSIAGKDSLRMALAYSNIGEYYMGGIGNADSSFAYYKKAEKLYRKLNKKINLATTYINIAILQNKINDYIGSEHSAIKALEELNGTSEKYKVYEAYNIIAITANMQRDYKRCLEYHNKALQVANSNKLPKEFHPIAGTFNNIGTVFQDEKNYKKAIEYYEKALKETDLFIDKPTTYAIFLGNLGYSKFCANDYSDLPALFYKSLKISDSLSYYPESILARTRLSEYYFKVKDTAKAKKYAVEALNLSRESKLDKSLLFSLSQAAAVDDKKASDYREEYITLSDSIHLEERKMQNKFARIEFETDEIVLEKDKAIGQKWTILWIAISAFLSGVLFYAYRMQRSKQRELVLLQSQQKADEEIYQLILDQQQKFDEGREKEKKRIAKELHDGIMNRLASIRFNLFVLENRTDPETIKHCIGQIEQIQEVEKEVKDIAHDLSHDTFSPKKDYEELLRSLALEVANAASLKISLWFSKSIKWETINAVVKMHIYRILQESLHNIKKHAAAKEVSINIAQESELLHIEIKDDGVGFDAEAHSSGLGIGNIQSRAEEMNGSSEITSSSAGTVVRIKIPI